MQDAMSAASVDDLNFDSIMLVRPRGEVRLSAGSAKIGVRAQWQLGTALHIGAPAFAVHTHRLYMRHVQRPETPGDHGRRIVVAEM